MKERFTENGIEYVRNSNYYIPNLSVPNDKKYNIGKYGRLREKFLKEHHNCFYLTLIFEGTLLEHLAEVDELCHKQLDELMETMKKREGVTEQLKATDQMKWVCLMNNLKNRIEEIILNDYVYGGFDE